jgi:hypothetical protein
VLESEAVAMVGKRFAFKRLPGEVADAVTVQIEGRIEKS